MVRAYRVLLVYYQSLILRPGGESAFSRYIHSRSSLRRLSWILDLLYVIALTLRWDIEWSNWLKCVGICLLVLLLISRRCSLIRSDSFLHVSPI